MKSINTFDGLFCLVIKDVEAAVVNDAAYTKKKLDNPFWIRKSKKRDRKRCSLILGVAIEETLEIGFVFECNHWIKLNRRTGDKSY